MKALSVIEAVFILLLFLSWWGQHIQNKQLKEQLKVKPITELEIISRDTNVHAITGKYWYQVQPVNCVICDSIAVCSEDLFVVGYDKLQIVKK
jgi:hypothetical protein